MRRLAALCGSEAGPFQTLPVGWLRILPTDAPLASVSAWTYDRAIERDRLCDWLRWQKDRFLGFLDYAATHGSEALSRMLIDEMFLVERRVKKEGRGAGGMRPLRMWRGD